MRPELLDLAQMVHLICRNGIGPMPGHIRLMKLDPAPDLELDVMPRRPSLGLVLSIFVALVGVIAVFAILVVYGLATVL